MLTPDERQEIDAELTNMSRGIAIAYGCRYGESGYYPGDDGEVTFGNPDENFCIDISPRDRCSVYVGGVDVFARDIPGAYAHATRALNEDDYYYTGDE